MRRKLLLLFGLILSCGMMAAPVTLQEAQQRAQQFLSRHGAAPHGMRLAKQQPRLEAAQQDNAYYYVFNVGQEQGFVIVSGDDRTPAILGYADQGSFADQDMPDNMRAWLQGYEEQMKWMEQAGYQAPAKAPNKVAKQAIAELLTTTWDQGDPYNRLCPLFLTGNRSVTGCVATAMAQALYYHGSRTGKPAGTTKVIAAYDCASNWGSRVHVDAKEATTFNWGKMLTSYDGKTGSEYDTECNAVATLMAWCGASVQMDYADSDNGGSGSNLYLVATALPEYFDCEGTYVSRDDYTYQHWVDLIYAEIAEGRPVVYGGQSSGGGHAFVIDGYDGEELFHVNWGWGGSSNGYFVLSVLNSHNNSGIGASSSSDGYSFGQDAVIGLQPNTGVTPVESGKQMTFQNITIDGNTIKSEAWNFNNEQLSFNYGFGYLEDNGTVTPIDYRTGTHAYSYGTSGLTVTIDASSKPAGSYKIVPISKETSQTEWLTQWNTEKKYIEAVFDGAGAVTLTLHPTVQLAADQFDLPGTKFQGQEQTVNVLIQNNGDEYYGQLFFFASQSQGNMGSTKNSGGLTLLENESSTMQFVFTPDTEGTWYMWVATDEIGNNVIGSAEVEIATDPYSPSGRFMVSSMTVTAAMELKDAVSLEDKL